MGSIRMHGTKSKTRLEHDGRAGSVRRVASRESGASPPLWSTLGGPEVLDIVGSIPVSEVMTQNPVCLPEDQSVESARLLLLERGFSAAPVVDRQGHPLGIVTKTDILRELPEFEVQELRVKDDRSAAGSMDEDLVDRDEAESGEGFLVMEVPGRTVHEIMTPFVFTLPLTAPLARAADLMVAERVHHVPVVDPDRRVVGMVASSDIVRLLAGHLIRNGAPRVDRNGEGIGIRQPGPGDSPVPRKG